MLRQFWRLIATGITSAEAALKVESALGSPVGMNDRAHRFATPPGHLDRVDDQLGAQVIGDRPADTAAGEHVDDRGAVNPPLESAVLRDVHDPKPVGCVSGEHPLDVILEYRREPATATAPPFAVVNTLQPCNAHQPLDPAVTDPQPPSEDELGMNTADPVGSPSESVKLQDRIDGVSIIDIAS